MKLEDNAQVKSNYKQRRAVLSSISVKMRKIREYKAESAKSEEMALYWSTRTINEMLMLRLYNKEQNKEFKTFWQWKKEGKTIKKGSKSVTVWGQPTQAQKKQAAEIAKMEENIEKYEFFPICYLFSSDDIVDTNRKTEPKADPIRDLEPAESFYL